VSTTTNPREEFCLALKAARERKGITLDEIEKTTKIPAFMFAALERCDLSRWPKGFFRRSFFRDYVQMLSLPVSEACAQFVRLFPDDDGVAPVEAAPKVSSPPSAMATIWRRIAESVSRAIRQMDDDPSGAAPESEERVWVSDARRVGPGPAKEFRVRIKLPK
jgi:hypothetical protein